MQIRSLNKKIIENLERLSETKLRALNAPVFIRELCLIQLNDKSSDHPPIGEFDPSTITNVRLDLNLIKKETEDQLITRMMRFINDLARIATMEHMENNFLHAEKLSEAAFESASASHAQVNNEVYWEAFKKIFNSNNPIAEMDPTKQNEITRLSMNEFALYPHKERGPLTRLGFNKLLEAIYQVAKCCPFNLHLVLGTLPVKTASKVHNVGVVVECGPEPRLHVFSKAVPARFDPVYPNTRNRRFANDYEKVIQEMPSMALTYQHNRTRAKGLNVPYSANIICKTGTTEFRTVIDICLDHDLGVGKKRLEKEVLSALEIGSGYLPQAISYLVISNHVDLNPESFVSIAATQVDPVNFKKNNEVNNPYWTRDINTPLFGSHALIYFYPRKELGPHIDKLEKAVNVNNNFFTRLNALRQYRAQRPLEYLSVHEEMEKHIFGFLEAEINILKHTANNVMIDELNKHASLLQDVIHSPLNALSKSSTLFYELDDIAEKCKSTSPTMSQTIKTLIQTTKKLLRAERRYLFNRLVEDAKTIRKGIVIECLYQFVQNNIQTKGEFFDTELIKPLLKDFPDFIPKLFTKALGDEKLLSAVTNWFAKDETVFNHLPLELRYQLLDVKVDPEFNVKLWKSFDKDTVTSIVATHDIEVLLHTITPASYFALSVNNRSKLVTRVIKSLNNDPHISPSLEGKLNTLVSLDFRLSRSNYVAHRIKLLSRLRQQYVERTRNPASQYVLPISFDEVLESIYKLKHRYEDVDVALSTEQQIEFLNVLIDLQSSVSLSSEIKHDELKAIFEMVYMKLVKNYDPNSSLSSDAYLNSINMNLSLSPWELSIEFKSIRLFELYFEKAEEKIEFAVNFIRKTMDDKNKNELENVYEIIAEYAEQIVAQLTLAECNKLINKSSNDKFNYALTNRIDAIELLANESKLSDMDSEASAAKEQLLDTQSPFSMVGHSIFVDSNATPSPFFRESETSATPKPPQIGKSFKK